MRTNDQPAVEAHRKLSKFNAARLFLRPNDPDMSEADTRSKLIDPLFLDVLGWQEQDIRREEPVSDGFADYSFGLDFKWFHVEAKRTLPRFELHVSSSVRRLTLTGPHMLGNKRMKPLLEQTAKYSLDLGTEFAILTNGSQFIVFQSLVGGRSWKHGHAIVWHSIDDIIDNFAEFYELLQKTNVESGILAAKFSNIVSVTSASFTPLQYIHNPEAELVRNPFWSRIAQAFSPILIDKPEDDELQEEIIRNCYVSTPLAGESSSDLGRLLRDIMPHYLVDANVRHIDPSDRGPGSFTNRVVDDLKILKPGTYILTGGVGSGKTTFLRRFARVDQHAFIRDFCVWLHIDFLEFGSDVDENLAPRLERYTTERIYAILQREYSSYLPKNGDEMRKLFADEISRLETTLLHGVEKDSTQYRDAVNLRIDELSKDSAAYVNAILQAIKKAGRCIVFVLDNTDQLGEQFQRAVFLYSQKLSDSFRTLSIVSLREEKFFAAFRQGLFDAYGTRKFHIGSPDLIQVLRRRLEYGIKRYMSLADEKKIGSEERAESIAVAKTLITVSTSSNGNIIRFLASVSVGDMRLALRMFNDFMSSGNTDVRKIQRIVAKGGTRYKMPFHEFAKAAILGSRRYFRGSVSRILNVFLPSSIAGASHWTACRILARALSGMKAYCWEKGTYKQSCLYGSIANHLGARRTSRIPANGCLRRVYSNLNHLDLQNSTLLRLSG